MTTRNRKLNERMAALLGGDAGAEDDSIEMDSMQDSSLAELTSTEKLIQDHREEHDFYLEYAKTHPVRQWQDIPDSPRELTTFSMRDYLEAALASAKYEQDEDGLIAASVPNFPDFYSQGETHEEARTNLLEAIEENLMIALQMGSEIPIIPGIDITTEVVSSDPETMSP